MITQKEVAELAGVSFITVSRVVNKEGNVREETRIRVEKAIKELGYVPSFAGKALNSGRNDTIGVMTPARFGEGLENFYLMGVLRGIETACRDRGFDILISPLMEENPAFDFLRPYKQRKVDGMIYVGLQKMGADLLRELAERRMPCVVVADRPETESLSWIDTDNETSAYETTRRIIELGHRRVAFHGLDERLFNTNIKDRERGYLRAMREAFGTDGEKGLIIRAGHDKKSIYDSIRETFSKSGQDITALFCATDHRVLSALSALRELGIRVPDDVSLVGFDGFLKDYGVYPSIATNEQPLYAMGLRAAEVLIQRIASPIMSKYTEVFPVPFIPGESLAPPNRKQA